MAGSRASELSLMPFSKLTNHQLSQEFEIPRIKFKTILSDHNFTPYLQKWYRMKYQIM